MLESYVHTLLKSILGTYVNLNEDDEALRVSVWEGQVELRDLMLQCQAFEPLCKDLPFSVHAGCIGYFKLQVPLMNLGGQPIQVHVKDVFILLRPRQPSKLAANTSMPADAKAYLLQAKRATLQALEIEQEKDPNKAENSSTFVSRLLTKLLDNIQIHVEHVHVRIEDAFSYPQAPYSCGITMDEVAIRSTDAGWNYTLNVRDSGASCLRKVFEIKRLGVYWSGSFNEVNDVNDVNALSSGMGRMFLQQTSCPYLCEPMTLSMKLLMNDRGDMIPLTFKEFTQRVMSRLGISWMVETIDAIGEEAWSNFVSRMPPLVGGRSYTLSFVFAEAWSVALEHIMREDEEDDPIPTLEDFKAALRSCFQWSDLDAISPSIAKYREAAIYVLQEKSTYLTIEAQIDDFSLRVEQSQYHSILAFLSLLSFRQRQLKYAHLRPITSVHANPTAWWHFCIEAVIIDTRARLRKIDWEYVRKKKMQKRRYVELYIEIHDQENFPEHIRVEYDALEYDMDNKDILVCRAEAKKRIAEIQTRRAPPASSYLSYSYWFGSNNTDPSKRELEKEYFYDAIDYDPNEVNPKLLDSRIKYRVQLELQKFRTEIIQGMCTLVTLHGINMSLELSKRQDNTNLLMEVSEFEMEEPLNTCKVSRLPMDIVMQNENAHEISGVRLRLCEKPLPLISCKIELPQIGNVQADLGITFISQPMQAFFDMPFVLSVASFFKAPPSIDLSDIDAAAWERAKTFSKFSAAQLRQAIATRTKVCLNVDVTSPIVTLTEKSLTEEPVVVTMYFGHFRAISKLQPNIDVEGYENSKAEFLAKLPEEQLHDQVQLIIRGVQIGLNGEMPLLERAEAECTLKTSVAPVDPTIPLMKINGNMCSLSLELSSTGYDKLRRLLTSLSDNIVDQFPTLPQTEWKEEKTVPKAKEILEPVDFIRLSNRIHLVCQFSVQNVRMALYEKNNQALVSLNLTDITSKIQLRSFDKRIEFGLGTFVVDDNLHGGILVSSTKGQSLIELSITVIDSERPLVKDSAISVWQAVGYPQKGFAPLWKDIMHHPLSVDISFDALSIELHQRTLARIMHFFFQPSDPIHHHPPLLESIPENTLVSSTSDMSQSTDWVSSPFVTALIAEASGFQNVNEEYLQIQVHLKSIELLMKNDHNETLARCTASSFYCYLNKSHRICIAMSLDSLLLTNHQGRRIMYSEAKSINSEQVRETNGIEQIHNRLAMLTLAYESYGSDNFEEPWHPGYCSSLSIRMRAPRICFVYIFLRDIEHYLLSGPVMECFEDIWPRNSQDVISASVNLESSNVSTFPMIRITLYDTVLEMPRNSTSHEALVCRSDLFELKNGLHLSSANFDPLAKVLLNSRLRDLQLSVQGLRVVSSLSGTLSLLGGTDVNVEIDLQMVEIKLKSSPIRFVSSQEQYTFLLSGPLSNLNEESSFYPLIDEPKTSSKEQATFRISLSISVPELSIELIEGCEGYQPTSTGDLSLAYRCHMASFACFSITNLHLTVKKEDILSLAVTIDIIAMKDSRHVAKISDPYRAVVSLGSENVPAVKLVFTQSCMDVLTNSNGNKTTSDVIPNESNINTDSNQVRQVVELDLGDIKCIPSQFLLSISNFFARDSERKDISDSQDVELIDSPQSRLSYVPLALNIRCHNTSVWLIEDLSKESSRILTINWDAKAELLLNNGTECHIILDEVQAGSKLSDVSSLMKPFQLDFIGVYSPSDSSIIMKTDRAVILRFGYMDYVTLLTCLKNLLPPGPDNDEPTHKHFVPSFMTTPKERIPILYGETRLKLVLFNTIGASQSKESLGQYSGHWRKYLMVPPKGHLASGFETARFFLVPIKDDLNGKQVRYGDSFWLLDASGGFVSKFDQLGSSGYLGKDGNAGRLECRLFQQGSTFFNCDRKGIFSGDVVEFEGLTIYNPAREKKDGGYLMFNGVGDAPVVFVVETESEVPSTLPSRQHISTLAIQVSLPGIRLTVVNDFNNMHLPLMHWELIPFNLNLRGYDFRRYSCVINLSTNLQVYNSELAVWEPLIEEFAVDVAWHKAGGVLCDQCLYEEDNTCPQTPKCTISKRASKPFTKIASRAYESKLQIYRDLLNQEFKDCVADTLLLNSSTGMAVNISRNSINVLLHTIQVFSPSLKNFVRPDTSLGSCVYIDNQSGMILSYALDDFGKKRSDDESPKHKKIWKNIQPGECLPTSILAHEAPAGIVMAPMRRLIRLMDASTNKTMIVPIEHGNKSYFQFQMEQPLIGETVAEHGTLVLRIRSAVKLRNNLKIPILLLNDESEVNKLMPGEVAYIPLHSLYGGHIIPELPLGELERSSPLHWSSLISDLKSTDEQTKPQIKVLTFFWKVHPPSNGIVPPFNILLVSSIQDMDVSFELHAPVLIQNLLPQNLTFNTFQQDGGLATVEGRIKPGETSTVCTLDVTSSTFVSITVENIPVFVQDQQTLIFCPKMTPESRYLQISDDCFIVMDIAHAFKPVTGTRIVPITCTFFCEFWLIDRTGLNLSFIVKSSLEIKPNMVDFGGCHENPLTMLSNCQPQLTIVKDRHWRTQQIDIHAVGTRACLALKDYSDERRMTKRISNLSRILEHGEANPSQYAIGMRIDQGPAIFSRTVIVTFTSRYKLQNNSKCTILEIQQDNEHFVLMPQQHRYLKGSRLRIRIQDHLWSEELEMEAVGDTMLKVQEEPPSHQIFPQGYSSDIPCDRIVQASIQLQDPMILVSLLTQEEHIENSLYLIRNECTHFKVVVWQKNSCISYPTILCVQPHESIDYVPDQSVSNPTLCLQIQSAVLFEGKQASLYVPSVTAIANVEVTIDKPHRLPIIHVGKRRIWINVTIEGTAKVIVVTDVLPGISHVHQEKRQAMLLRDWKRILNYMHATRSMIDQYHRSPAKSLFETVHQWTCNLRILEGRRFEVLTQTRDKFNAFVRINWTTIRKETYPQKFAVSPVWLPLDFEAFNCVVDESCSIFRLEIWQSDNFFGSKNIGFIEFDTLDYLKGHSYGVLDVWFPVISQMSSEKSSATVHIHLSHQPYHIDSEIKYTSAEDESFLLVLEKEIENLKRCQESFRHVLLSESLDVGADEIVNTNKLRSSVLSSVASESSEDTLLDDKRELCIVVMNATHTGLDAEKRIFYCAVECDTATRCTNPIGATSLPPSRERKSESLTFSSSAPLGLDLVYHEGKISIHAVHFNGQCGPMVREDLIKVGDVISAINSQIIVNLSKDAAFAAIEKAKASAPTFNMTIIPTSDELRWDVEWNRRVTFEEVHGDYVKVYLYQRDVQRDYGLSSEKESSVLPFLYFFGEDKILDTLNPSRQHCHEDELVAMCWVKLSDDDDDLVSMGHSRERLCALYQSDNSNLEIVGTIRLAIKWQPKRLEDDQNTLVLYAQVEIKHLYVSFLSDSEVLLASLSGSAQLPGIQLSFGFLSDRRQIVNTRLSHLQIDNQMLDTNYPVLLTPVPSSTADPVPAFQSMIVAHFSTSVMHFEYIFAQLQELEVKVEDFVLVAIVGVFSGIDWNAWKHQDVLPTNPYDLIVSEGIISNMENVENDSNMKIAIQWLLLCPIKLRVTFSSTTDRPLTHSILSPSMSPLLRNFIGAAAALVTNLDRAPIEVPEFYIENVIETKHALGYYVMQHYVHFGLRSWYKIVGSVDVLGNPVGLVSTLGTGVRDFFFTPAQMLLEDESGLRIDNLRTGMTKGSKSLLRNTAVGIFHTTGKITETLGKGLAMLAMDTEYNAQRQQRALRQATTIGHIGDGIVEGGKDLAGGIWDGVRGVVVEPVVGAATDGASGFIVGLGKGFAGLVVKPTAGILDLLNSVSQGVKATAESIDGRMERKGTTRIRLPRRIEQDGVLVAYSQREATGSAIILLSGLQDNYIFHIETNDGGIVLLTDKRITWLSKGSQIWEVALDSTIQVRVEERMLLLSRGGRKLYTILCRDDSSPKHFSAAVISLSYSSIQDTRYLLLNLEQGAENLSASRPSLDAADRAVQLDIDDLRGQPIRSIKIELCHIENKDAHTRVPHRSMDVVVPFTVYRLLVLGGPYQWSVFRRYSEFRDLHVKLEESGLNVSILPSLPGRQLLFSTSDSIVKHRKEALSMYLEAILIQPFILNCEETIDFLTHDASEIQVAHVTLP